MQFGTIYGTPTAAAALDADLDAAYRAAGGPSGKLGWPTTNVTEIDTGANGAGRVIRFAGGMLYESDAGSFTVITRMQTAFEAAGWVRGAMGWPIAAPSCTLPGGGCMQRFQHGDIYMPKTGKGYAISNEGMAAAYRAAGGPAGSLGWPITSTKAMSGVGAVGYAQAFSSGAYMYSHDGNVVTLPKKYYLIYKAAGGPRGALGWPTHSPVCTLPGGGCQVDFDNGSLYQPASGAGFVISNAAIATAYAAEGGVSGVLGWPRTSTVSMNTVTNGRGYAQGFTGGYIYTSPAGTFVLEKIAQAGYAAAGGPRGALGWPTADSVCDANGCTQAFQDGTLFLPATGPAFAITDTRIATYYDAHGGPGGELGYPTTATKRITTPSNGSGYVQGFTGGYIYATNGFGTFAVMAPMQAEFKAAGWVRGPLGFPASDESCTGGICTQTFAHGTLTTP
jgi:uncharacterized protein with LGFP repeats